MNATVERLHAGLRVDIQILKLHHFGARLFRTGTGCNPAAGEPQGRRNDQGQPVRGLDSRVHDDLLTSVVCHFTPASDWRFANGPYASGATLRIAGQQILREFLGSREISRRHRHADACAHRVRVWPIGFAFIGRVGACFSRSARERISNPMTSEENRRVPLSTEVSPRETEVDWQPSARVRDTNGPAAPQAPGAQSPSTERLAIGQLLGGRYRIERELGEGGMGVVYLAADEQVPGEKFAIKVLKEQLNAEALTLLREEVRKTRKLSHANIVDVHSVNVDGQRLYVLMEYLEGRSLDALLDEEFGRGMPFSHAWPIIEDVGAALANAHDHNVIHSDLKPANVFLTNSGRTKLLDFGIA